MAGYLLTRVQDVAVGLGYAPFAQRQPNKARTDYPRAVDAGGLGVAACRGAPRSPRRFWPMAGF